MADKRISQLNALTTPTGSDLLVIVNNNETKKITYANLVASLTGSETDLSALNQFTQSIDGRVDSLESWSSSLDSTFATDLQVSIVSSSVAATIGVISQNTGLLSTASFNQYTASISTGSLVDRLDNLELESGSYKLNWNTNREYLVKNTEQLIFSGDYILSSSNLYVEGGSELIQYSTNKYFKKVGRIFIGGNLLVKDSYIENNGEISVGGEIILIGNSQIVGTGKII